MDKIEKIRQEIERRKELLTPHKGQGVILCGEIIKQFDSLLSFIDTISQPIIRNDIVDEIRAEIERRFSEYNHDSNHHIQAAECASILDFLDSLSEEPDKSLEEAAKDYAIRQLDKHFWQDVECFGAGDIDAFIAGAEWQASQMPVPEDTVLFNKGVAEGRGLEREDMMKDGNVILAEEDFDAEKEKLMEWGYNLCKQQMLKDAVEGEVCGRVYDHINVRFADGVCKYLEPKNISHIPADVSKYNIGQKVRIVVLKEEDEK